MISARGLTKRFGRSAALRGVDLEIAPGESVALLGPNGAGKTTLLRLLATLDKPTSGRLSVAGFDVHSHAVDVRRRVGLVAHQTYLHAELTATENLRFYCRLYGVPVEAVENCLVEVGLAGRANVRVSALSRGQQQRLAIARALLHDPTVLLMDEPDTGLDADGMALLGRILASRRTVLFSSHNHSWARSCAGRAVWLTAGRVGETAEPGG
ncbi:MAG: heme ABC exporter ATP-binding protein CcmA [Chloroflexi bacterium]|nr:heme ABC exporter ATP-binding protein CcmA [Chloroflexota bacterium]